MHLSKTRIGLRLLGLASVALLAWVAWATFQPPFQPPHERPNISFTLLGHTNNADGTQLAMIAITNLSNSKIFIYHPIIEIPMATDSAGVAVYPSGQAYYHSDYFRWHSTLGSGTSDILTVPTPTNQSPWRLTLLADYDSHLGVAQNIQSFIVGRTARRMPYDLESDWIQN